MRTAHSKLQTVLNARRVGQSIRLIQHVARAIPRSRPIQVARRAHCWPAGPTIGARDCATSAPLPQSGARQSGSATADRRPIWLGRDSDERRGGCFALIQRPRPRLLPDWGADWPHAHNGARREDGERGIPREAEERATGDRNNNRPAGREICAAPVGKAGPPPSGPTKRAAAAN